MEDWEIIMYDVIKETNAASVLFFVTWVVLGKYIFLTLFLAVILDAFESKFSNGDLSSASSLDNDHTNSKYIFYINYIFINI